MQVPEHDRSCLRLLWRPRRKESVHINECQRHIFGATKSSPNCANYLLKWLGHYKEVLNPIAASNTKHLRHWQFHELCRNTRRSNRWYPPNVQSYWQRSLHYHLLRVHMRQLRKGIWTRNGKDRHEQLGPGEEAAILMLKEQFQFLAETSTDRRYFKTVSNKTKFHVFDVVTERSGCLQWPTYSFNKIITQPT